MTNLARHLKEPVIALRTIVANVAEFQTLTGAVDADAALVFTHSGYAEEKSGPAAAQNAKALPRATVLMQDYRSERNSNVWNTTIALTVRLVANDIIANRDLSLSGRYEWWLGLVGQIIDGIKAAGRDKLNSVEIRMGVIPQFAAVPQDWPEFQITKTGWVAEFYVEAKG